MSGKNNIARCIFLTMCGLLLWSGSNQGAALHVDEPPDRLVLPGHGLVQIEEGTIEFWVQLHFDPTEVTDGWVGRAHPFHYAFGDRLHSGDSIDFRLGSRGTRLTYIRSFITSGGQGVSNPANTGFGRGAEQGEWYHFAFTWSQEERRVQSYIAGRPAAGRDFLAERHLAPQITSEAKLYLGSAPDAAAITGPVALANVRISSVIRSAEEIRVAAETGVVADRFTLFLLDFTPVKENGRLAVQPVAATSAAERPFLLPAAYRIVAGPFGGYALDLRDAD